MVQRREETSSGFFLKRAFASKAALRGAFLASCILIGFAAARGFLDIWMLAIAAIAIGLGALSFAKHPRDLSSQKRPALSFSQDISERLLAAIPDPTILLDGQALVLAFNKPALSLFPALQHKEPLSLVLRSPDLLKGVEDALASGRSQRVEYSARVPTVRLFEIHIETLIRNDQESAEKPNLVLFFRDLTGARKLEHMRVDFVANASHELRTPLTSLLGFIETLQGPARNDVAARERFLEIMREQAERMKRLVDDLLSLSRIEMRAHLPPADAIDLVSVVSHMAETLAPLMQEHGMRMELNVPSEPLWVLGDRDELLRVTENLIENAVKYGESGGRLEVTLKRSESRESKTSLIELSVKDYGPGIAPQHLPRLTERFYRVDVNESRQKGGTGLGLAIVKHIINRHSGKLVIDSEVGQGAIFTVSLPEKTS